MRFSMSAVQDKQPKGVDPRLVDPKVNESKVSMPRVDEPMWVQLWQCFE